MRGGELVPRDFNGRDLTPSIHEQDWGRMDQIQVTFANFQIANLEYVRRPTNTLLNSLRDTGDTDPAIWKNLEDHIDRARRYDLLCYALGRVTLPTGYRAIWYTEEQLKDLDGALWLQDTGRSGGRNRYMGILQTKLGEQASDYQDVQTYEGHTLPFYLPYVLHETEWDQIFDDVYDNHAESLGYNPLNEKGEYNNADLS